MDLSRVSGGTVQKLDATAHHLIWSVSEDILHTCVTIQDTEGSVSIYDQASLQHAVWFVF